MAGPVSADRWMEIDLYWFERTDISGSVAAFWERFGPLYVGVEGSRGLILNVGWTVQYIMGWPGQLDQGIELPTGSGQEPWVPENAPLSGTWKEQEKEWKQRFARPVIVPRHAYGPWTYGDLKHLIEELKTAAARRGLHDFKVGSLTYAWPDAYGEIAPWAKRHPEAFAKPPSSSHFNFSYFDPSARLHHDNSPLGALPEGIPEGMPAHAAFAAQWGSLSKAVGLDALMLRDSFGFPVPYHRAGPFGALAPSFQVAEKFTASVAALIRETKQANPAALVMMYSNAASAVADWRSNCCDLESIARQGYLDIFVDQTWAGAWNEVGVRQNDFWNNPMLGWTYQLAYTLVHAAVLAGTRVRHYPLVETFDAWESWDVIHTVPERLRWGIWAYSHAAVKTPRGLKVPAGSYISWANQGKRLLSEADVHFLATNIDQAVADAQSTRDVPGPTLVYSREAMAWQMHHAPKQDIKEWIDEQVGSLIKWPVPVLSSTRAEWLPEVHSSLLILQTPVHLNPRLNGYIAGLLEKGQPVAIFGSPAGGIDPELMRLAGLGSSRAADPEAKRRVATLARGAQRFLANVPDTFPTRTCLTKTTLEAGAHALYSVGGSPALEVDTESGKKVVAWDPPDFAYGRRQPLRDDWGGSPAAPALAAGALNSLLSTPENLHAAKIDMNQTMNVSAWLTLDGHVHILAANLEEGLRDSADMSRHATLVIPDSWKIREFTDQWTGRPYPVRGGKIMLELSHAESVLLTAPSPLRSRG